MLAFKEKKIITKNTKLLECETKHKKNINFYNEIINLLISIYKKAKKNNQNKLFMIKKYFTNDFCYETISKTNKFIDDLKEYSSITNDKITKDILTQHLNNYKKLLPALKCIINNDISIIKFIENNIIEEEEILKMINEIPSPPKTKLN